MANQVNVKIRTTYIVNLRDADKSSLGAGTTGKTFNSAHIPVGDSTFSHQIGVPCAFATFFDSDGNPIADVFWKVDPNYPTEKIIISSTMEYSNATLNLLGLL